MISTDFLAGQGLGNQLWVYAACRGIAGNLGLPFSIGGKSCFKGRGFLEIDWGHAEEALAGNERSFHEEAFYDPELKYVASDYDPLVETLKANTRLNGLFQSEAYFYGTDLAAAQWIRLSEETFEKSLRYRDVCVLNIRGGEYKNHKNLLLPKSYWLNGIKNIREKTDTDRFLIVTDDRAYAKALLDDIEVLEGGISDCYAALHGARCLIVSNSSFSYFPIKTRSDRPYVIAPYLWSRFSNVHQRWASPANLYKDWVWQDGEGALHSYEGCRPIRDRTDAFYKTNYKLRTEASALQLGGTFRMVPAKIKKPVKYILGKLFPKRFG